MLQTTRPSLSDEETPGTSVPDLTFGRPTDDIGHITHVVPHHDNAEREAWLAIMSCSHAQFTHYSRKCAGNHASIDETKREPLRGYACIPYVAHRQEKPSASLPKKVPATCHRVRKRRLGKACPLRQTIPVGCMLMAALPGVSIAQTCNDSTVPC